MEEVTLPELPRAAISDWRAKSGLPPTLIGSYGADQMREYARAAVQKASYSGDVPLATIADSLQQWIDWCAKEWPSGPPEDAVLMRFPVDPTFAVVRNWVVAIRAAAIRGEGGR